MSHLFQLVVAEVRRAPAGVVRVDDRVPSPSTPITSPLMPRFRDPASQDRIRVECAWCGGHVSGPESGAAERVSHGMCGSCLAESGLFEVADVFGMSSGEADRLPYGFMVLNRSGRILLYNSQEERIAGRRREDVLGKRFFDEIAPCTAVKKFQGRFEEMVAAGEVARERFDFVFRFEHGAKLVEISIVWDPTAELATILVDNPIDTMD